MNFLYTLSISPTDPSTLITGVLKSHQALRDGPSGRGQKARPGAAESVQG